MGAKERDNGLSSATDVKQLLNKKGVLSAKRQFYGVDIEQSFENLEELFEWVVKNQDVQHRVSMELLTPMSGDLTRENNQESLVLTVGAEQFTVPRTDGESYELSTDIRSYFLLNLLLRDSGVRMFNWGIFKISMDSPGFQTHPEHPILWFWLLKEHGLNASELVSRYNQAEKEASQILRGILSSSSQSMT